MGQLTMSKTFQSKLHKLIFRSVLFICALSLFFIDRSQLDFTTVPGLNVGWLLLIVFWVALVIDMFHCLIPNKRIAAGARKHFPALDKQSNLNFDMALISNLNKGAVKSALAWILLNAIVFFLLAHFDMLIPETAVLLMLFYSVSDLICVLFFCPFQKLFMRNRCCTTCRIHNWDYFMMCTPMIFFIHVYSFSLLFISLGVLIRWELSVLKNPQQFVEQTNVNLSCSSCSDHFCLIRRPAS
jgi:hypothetical protein